MLKTRHGPNSKAAPAWSIMVFAVGGRRLAARADEVGGIRSWRAPVPVPSGTPFVHSLVRLGDEVLPVFDLAGRLNVRVKGAMPLCLIAKRKDGVMAICIDEEIPTLHSVEAGRVTAAGPTHADMHGTCTIAGEEVPIFALATLGLAR